MANRRVPVSIKKDKGSFNVTRDVNSEFNLWDGQVKVCPPAPKYFQQWQVEEWETVWKHLIKHEYGKNADVRLVEAYICEMGKYFSVCKEEDKHVEATKALTMMLKVSEALGLNPAAMSKVAVLQKKKDKPGISDLTKPREKLG